MREERTYPKLVEQEGDEERYGDLNVKFDEFIFSAYGKAEVRKAMIVIIANSDSMNTSKSLFWADVIMLVGADWHLMQSLFMALGNQKQTEMSPITIVFAGINDQLHSRVFLSRFRIAATAEAAMRLAIKNIMESMREIIDVLRDGSFQKITPRAVFVLSPGYTILPDGLNFGYAMIALFSDEMYDVIIPYPNRELDQRSFRPLRAELHAVWSDISNAMRGLKALPLLMIVSNEVLGLELSNFNRQQKAKT